MKIRRLDSRALEKVWGTPDTEPWYPHGTAKTGEVWFVAPEEPRLLVKFLFTSEKLSVQVHPSDSDSGPGKTEMWHVLRAGPEASLALGFVRPLSHDEARAAAVSGEIERLLRWYPAHPGDTFFVPAGTVHAIGAGIALCEIQQYSDVTYRLYDYGRPRELHLDAALAVADLGCHPGATAPVDLGDGRRLLAECPYFRTESLSIDGKSLHGRARRAQSYLSASRVKVSSAMSPSRRVRLWVVPAHTPEFEIGALNVRPTSAGVCAMKPGTLSSSVAAVVSALAAFSRLPAVRNVLVGGRIGRRSRILLPLEPYLIAFSVLMLAVGFVQAFRARQCGRGRRTLNIIVLLCLTGLVAAMLFGSSPGAAPAGQAAVTPLKVASFRQSFNAAADRTRVVALFSPT